MGQPRGERQAKGDQIAAQRLPEVEGLGRRQAGRAQRPPRAQPLVDQRQILSSGLALEAGRSGEVGLQPRLPGGAEALEARDRRAVRRAHRRDQFDEVLEVGLVAVVEDDQVGRTAQGGQGGVQFVHAPGLPQLDLLQVEIVGRAAGPPCPAERQGHGRLAAGAAPLH